MQNKDRIAIYSRKSKFTGKGESIGNQVELCREHIRCAWGEEYARSCAVYEDEGFSGGDLNRPGFRSMMQDARAGGFRAIVVYRLDRISRSISDFSALIEELGRLQIAFVSIREQFDTGNPMGRAMMYIASVFSQLERETIAERIRDNMHELAKTGRWLGGVTPTGYASERVESVTVDGKAKKSCRLKLIPREAELVRTVFELYLQTGSLSRTEAELLRRQYRTKTGREFTRFSIKGILQNPVYLMADGEAYQYFRARGAELFSPPEDFDGVRGVLAYNRTAQQKGKATVYLPVEQWIVCVGQHPGVIPARSWIAVQEALEDSRARTAPRPRSNEALLTGVLRCRCGSRMYPKLARGTDPEGGRVYRYVCKGKERSQGALCGCPNANGGELDRMLMGRLRALPEDLGELAALLERERWGEERAGVRALELRRAQAEQERRLAALVDSLADLGDGPARERVARRIEELHKKGGELAAQLAALEAPALGEEELARLCRRLARWESCELTVEQKRRAVRAAVRQVVWDGRCAQVYFFGGAEQAPSGEDSK